MKVKLVRPPCPKHPFKMAYQFFVFPIGSVCALRKESKLTHIILFSLWRGASFGWETENRDKQQAR